MKIKLCNKDRIMGHGTDNKIVPLRKDAKKYGLRTVPEMIFVRFFVRFWKELRKADRNIRRKGYAQLRTALSNSFMAQKKTNILQMFVFFWYARRDSNPRPFGS